MAIHFKKGLFLLLLLIPVLLLSGCSAILVEEETQDSVESFDAEIALDELPAGLYIRQDGSYTSPYEKYRTFSGTIEPVEYEKTKDSRIIWYTTQLESVPELHDEGLIVYKSDSSIPEYFTLESFEHLCDSVGIRGLTLSSTGKYSLTKSKGALHPLSTANSVLESYLEKGDILLDTINGTEIDSSMINKAGAIKGLEYGKKYRLGFYIGTRYYEVDLLADTHIYSSKTYYQLASYEMTKNGYLIVRLPELLTPGLYDLNSKGTFWYGGITTATHEEGSENPEAATESANTAIQETVNETLPIVDYVDIPVEATPSDEEELPDSADGSSSEAQESDATTEAKDTPEPTIPEP